MNSQYKGVGLILYNIILYYLALCSFFLIVDYCTNYLLSAFVSKAFRCVSDFHFENNQQIISIMTTLCAFLWGLMYLIITVLQNPLSEHEFFDANQWGISTNGDNNISFLSKLIIKKYLHPKLPLLVAFVSLCSGVFLCCQMLITRRYNAGVLCYLDKIDNSVLWRFHGDYLCQCSYNTPTRL
jgi:hypothetical protein